MIEIVGAVQDRVTELESLVTQLTWELAVERGEVAE